MREFLQKLQIKGFVAGFLIATFLVAAVFSAANNTSIREVLYGVNIVINGNRWTPPDDMQPFISDGRTFLPVRGIANALDVAVDWDEETFTVFLGEFPEDWSASPERVVFIGGDGQLIMTGAYVEYAETGYRRNPPYWSSPTPRWSGHHVAVTLTPDGQAAFSEAVQQLTGLSPRFNDNLVEMAIEQNPELFPEGITGVRSIPWNSFVVMLDGYVMGGAGFPLSDGLWRRDDGILLIPGLFSQSEAERLAYVLNEGRN